MNKEELEENAFEIISQAGDAKSDTMIALQRIKKGEYSLAKELLSTASKKLGKASSVHLKLLQQSISDDVPSNFLLIHAEDHYSTASFSHSLISELIDVFEAIDTRGHKE